ncbi:MAG: hypothetical protein IKP88_09950 [Lachnospiraceae bacterium]|nr:hypothetical protein [Lachnospiraceae bacterium]
MKKFFKALSLILALTLVIGTIPVSAASSFELLKAKKIIYIGNAQGVKEDGTKATARDRFRMSKLVAGFDSETMDIKLRQDDNTIVGISNKKDKVYARNIGKTNVTIYIYDKETGKLLDNFKTVVQVKKNATDLLGGFTVKDINGEIVDLDTKLGVNVPYTFTFSRKTADGTVLDTDYRKLVCDDAAVSIEKEKDYSKKFTVTFTKAGEFTLKASTYQSAIFNGDIISEDIKVKAGYDAVAVKQSGLASADVTFETAVTGLPADAFKAYYLIGETKIYPSNVNKVTCNENVATVEFLSNFIGGTEYYVEYDGTLVGSFKAAVITADSVVAIEIPTQTFEAGVQDQKLQYKLLNADGIDIKDLLGSTLNGVLSFVLEPADIDTYITSGSAPIIYIGTANKQYTVKATYSWINSQGDTKTAEGTGSVASVAPAAWQIGTVTGIVTAQNAADYVNGDGSINTNVKALNWTMDEAVSGAALQIAVPYTKNSDKKTETFATNGGVIYSSYSAKSSDETVVMLATLLPNGQKWNLIANKPGTSTIVIYGVTADGNKVAIGAVPVEVKAKREAKTFTVTPSKNTLNEGYYADCIDFTVVLKDQYDEEMKGVTYAVSKASGDPIYVADGYVAYETTGNKFTVWGDEVHTKTGVMNLKFTCGNLSQTVYINCGNESEAKTQVLKVQNWANGSQTIDTAIKQDTQYTGIEIFLEGRSQSGYVAEGEVIWFTEETPKTAPIVSGEAAEVYYVYTISKDGAVKKAADLGPNFDPFVDRIYAVTDSGASGAAVKFAAGTYTVTAYKVDTTNGTNRIVSVVGQSNFVVEDNQVKPVVTKNANAEKLPILDDYNIDKAFNVTFNGSGDGIIKKFNYTVDGTGSTAYVSSVDVTILNDVVGNFTINVAIDTLVKKG